MSLKWQEYEIVAPHDRANLERAAHILEQFHGMSRAVAEAEAYNKYRRLQHVKGAGHHLMGMIQSKGNNRAEDAKKHYLMYVMHTQAINMSHSGEISPEITAQKPIDWPFNDFVSADSDILLKTFQVLSNGGNQLS